MATQQLVNLTPTAISGLAEDVVYMIQAVGGQATFLETASTAPAADSLTASVLGDLMSARVKLESGQSAYVWSTGPRTSQQRVVINEEIRS